MKKINAIDVYLAMREYPGWMSDLKEMGFTETELTQFEELDAEYRGYDPGAEADEWLKEIGKEGGIDVWTAETDDQKLMLLSRKYSILRAQYFSHVTTNIEKALPLDLEIKVTEKLMDKIRARMIHVEHPHDSMRVTEYEITQARQYPLDRLLGDKLKKGRMPCPFHNGKDNNFSVKNGWGHCFVCQEWADSIKWIMRIEGKSFPDAVRQLNGA